MDLHGGVPSINSGHRLSLRCPELDEGPKGFKRVSDAKKVFEHRFSQMNADYTEKFVPFVKFVF